MGVLELRLGRITSDRSEYICSFIHDKQTDIVHLCFNLCVLLSNAFENERVIELVDLCFINYVRSSYTQTLQSNPNALNMLSEHWATVFTGNEADVLIRDVQRLLNI